MSTLTHPAPTVWQHWIASLDSSRRLLLRLGLGMAVAAPFLSGLLARGGDVALWIAEAISPLAAAVCAAWLAAGHETSGWSALLSLSARGRFQGLWLRIVTSVAYELAVGALGMVFVSVVRPGLDALGGLIVALPAVWLMALLASLAAGYSRSAWTGLGVAAVPWVATQLWGYGHSPLLSLQVLRATAEGEIFSSFWFLNRLTLGILGGVLWGCHGWLRPAAVQPRPAGTPLRLAGMAAAILGIYGAAGLAFSLFAGALLAAGTEWLPPQTLGKQLDRYRPVPAAALFGPAFAAYTGTGTAGEESKQSHTARVAQLTGALRRWPRSVWAPAITQELVREAEAWFPVRQPGLGTYGMAPAMTEVGSAPVLAALLDPQFTSISGELRQRIALGLAVEFPRTPEGQSGADYLLDSQALLSVESARSLAQRGVRVSDPARQPQWLLFLARNYLQQEQFYVARTLAVQAWVLARALLAGKGPSAVPLDEAKREELRLTANAAEQTVLTAGNALPQHVH